MAHSTERSLGTFWEFCCPLSGRRQSKRVASELVVFETSAALADKVEQWQERILSDGSRYEIYRRYFTAKELGGSRVLFDGIHFVVVASQ
jgi:hypothetical protein